MIPLMSILGYTFLCSLLKYQLNSKAIWFHISHALTKFSVNIFTWFLICSVYMADLLSKLFQLFSRKVLWRLDTFWITFFVASKYSTWRFESDWAYLGWTFAISFVISITRFWIVSIICRWFLMHLLEV